MTRKKTASTTKAAQSAPKRPTSKQYTTFAAAALDNKGKKASQGQWRFGSGQTLVIDVDESSVTPSQIKKVVDYVVKDRRADRDHRVTSVLRLIK